MKNIARPLRVWTRAPVSRPDARAARKGGTPGFPALTVRPVTATGTGSDQRDLAQALTLDFGSLLGPVVWLDTSVADEDRPGYALRSTLRARGDRMRLEARLFNPDGAEIWQQKYDGALDDSFDWQDQTAEDVAAETMNTILDAETRKLELIEDSALTPEQCTLMGMMAWRSFAPDAFERALALYDRAISANPNMPIAYSEAIIVTIAGRTMGIAKRLVPYEAKLPHWMEAARAFAGSSANLDISLAIGTYFQDKDATALAVKLTDLLRRAPFDARVLSFAGWGYLWSGKPDLALDCQIKAIRIGRLSPFHTAALGCAANAAIQLGRPEDGLRYARQGLERSSSYMALHAQMAAANALLGHQAEAEAALARYLALNPGRTLSRWRAENAYGGSDGGKLYMEGLRKAGMPE